ncbi:MAG TPA: HEAT repeat domain-containing protein [Bryobacteraceae bacterium]|jgi:HEAT repeat protein|nr:HEAT repeat domain-containing protein [Bryobacteraceae bacterium]
MTLRLLASFYPLLTISVLWAQDSPPSPQEEQVTARSILKEIYASPNSTKRELVVNSLGIATHDRGSVDMLTSSLKNDKDPKVRTLAAAAMSEGKCRDCISVLKQVLDDKDIVVAFAAGKALWDLGDRSGLPLFEEVLSGQRKDSEGIIHGALLDAHRTMHDPSALALLGVNEVAGTFLGPAGTALSFVEQGRKISGGTAGRVLAATLVGQDKSPSSQKLLEDMLSDKDGNVVAASCKALALRGSPGSLTMIAGLMDDSRDIVRAMSSAAVIRLTEPRPARRVVASPKR